MTTAYHTIQFSDGNSITFFSKKELVGWLQKEQQKWAWLWSGEKDGATIGADDFNSINNTFSSGLLFADREDEQGRGEFSNWLRNQLDGNQSRFLISQTPIGQAVLTSKDRIGIGAARVMYRTVWQGVEWQQHIRTPTDIKGVMLAGDPMQVEQSSVANELQQERANYRGAITKLENRVRELEREHRDHDARRINQMRKIVATLRSGVQKKAVDVVNGFAVESNAELVKIRETEDLFRRQMELKAPVEYWEEKAKRHENSETAYFRATISYFIIAALVIGISAFCGSKIIQSIPAGQDRAPLYIITSGALLAITTMVFWAGRLIVKLWLSEHHLRSDAQERAVMTKSYLAMTENDKAQDTDRAIVLSAIFRPAPDGVVKEEGPQDIGLHALMAKLLARP